MPLLALPGELLLEIVSYLCPYSTLRLSKASTKFFHLLRTPQRMKEILLFLERKKPQLFQGKEYVLPCYGCLEVRSAPAAFCYGRCLYQSSCCVPGLICCELFLGLGGLSYKERRCRTCNGQRSTDFLAAKERGSMGGEGSQSGSLSYSLEREDETRSDNESESEDEAESTEETESAGATESEDEAKN